MPTFEEYYSYWEKEAMRIKQDEERRKNHEREELEKVFDKIHIELKQEHTIQSLQMQVMYQTFMV